MKNIELNQNLEKIKKEIHLIRINMADKDMILSKEDYKSLAETAKEKKSGKLIDFEEIEKELER